MAEAAATGIAAAHTTAVPAADPVVAMAGTGAMELVILVHSPAVPAVVWATTAAQMAAAAMMQVVAVVQAAQGSAAVLVWEEMADLHTSGWTATIMPAAAVAQHMDQVAPGDWEVTPQPQHRKVVAEMEM